MQRLFLILLFMFFVSCGGSVDDSKAVVGLSAEELKVMLQADTTHVKALLFYSQACHSCKEMFEMYFKEAIDSCSTDVHFYIVSQDSAFMQPPIEYLSERGYEGKSYYITTIPANDNYSGFFRIDRIVQYLYPDHYPAMESKVGLPFTLILSKDNEICTNNYTRGDTTALDPLYLTKSNLQYVLENESK